MQKTKDECDSKLRTMNYDLHKMQHEVETTKKKIVDRAKRKSVMVRALNDKTVDDGVQDEESASHEYQINLLSTAIQALHGIQPPDLHDVMSSVEGISHTAETLSHSREDTGLSLESLDEHEAELSKVAEQTAATVSKTSRAMVQYQTRQKEAIKSIMEIQIHIT